MDKGLQSLEEIEAIEAEKNGLESLGKLTFLRSYSKNGEENYFDTVERYLNMMRAKYPKLKSSINGWGKFLHDKKIVPSMRGMQYAGDPIEKENLRLYNCCALGIEDYKDIADLCYLCACGCGVGVSVQRIFTDKLPIVTAGFTFYHSIGDTREDWADSFMLLCANPKIEFDYTRIRKAGAKLSSGGTASGPEPLRDAHEKIRAILRNRVGDRLRPIDVADVACLIAQAIVAGAARRSAEIILFDADDTDMLNFKADGWWDTHIHRAKANVSAVAQRGSEQVGIRVNGLLDAAFGEPGIVLVDAFDTTQNILINPCVRGNTLILTKDGNLPIEDLVGQEVEVFDGKQYVKVTPKMTGTKQRLVSVDVTTEDGRFVIECTPSHHFILKNGEKVRACDLKVCDILADYRWESAGQAYNCSGDVITAIRQVKGRHSVYCFTNDVNGTGIFNSVMTGQCAEVSLRNRSLCNLCEIILTNCMDEEDFLMACKAAAFFGTLQAGFTSFGYVKREWSEIAEEEALLGVSLTGVAQAQHFMKAQLLRSGVDNIRSTNKSIAKKIGISCAKRLTVTKPSGSTSATHGTTSGVHAAHAEYVIRRVRVAKLSTLGQNLIDIYGLPESAPVGTAYGTQLLPTDKYNFVVREAYNDTDIVLQFPCHFKNAIYRGEESSVDLLERAAFLYEHWVKPGHNEGQETNNVSLTVAVKPEEKPEVAEWMKSNQDKYRGISVLPYDASAYPLLPFEEVTPEEFLVYLMRFPKIDWEALGVKSEVHGSVACSGGAGCEVT